MSSILPGTTRGPTYARLFKKGASLRLLGGTSGYVDLVSPVAPTSYSLTLPTAMPGVTGYVLSCTDAGVLSWVAQTPATSPAGSGTEIQYRNAGAFGAVAGSSWDATTLALPKLSAISTTANQLTVGYDSTYKITLDVSSAGVLTLAGYKPSGTNVAAGAAYLDVPVSTGNAAPGSWVFRSTVATTSGSTAQTLADTLTVTNGRVGLSKPAPDFDFDIQSNAMPIVAITNFETSSSSPATIYLRHARGTKDSPSGVGPNDLLGRIYLWAYTSSWISPGRLDIASESGASLKWIWYNGATEWLRFTGGKIGLQTNTPAKQLEINAADGNCLRLTYNDSNGSAANYTDFSVSAAGNLTITPSGGIAYLTGNLEPAADDTYYLGRNDDDSPKAWKGVILKDTTNGKYYRIEVISGVVTATDLTD